MTINYFIIFPTAVFLGHKICQLRNSYHRWRSGICAVDTDEVVLVIPVVRQLLVAELMGWQKSLASLGMKSNSLAFFHPLTGCDIIQLLTNEELDMM